MKFYLQSSTIPESSADCIPGQHTQRSAEGVTLSLMSPFVRCVTGRGSLTDKITESRSEGFEKELNFLTRLSDLAVQRLIQSNLSLNRRLRFQIAMIFVITPQVNLHIISQ